MRILPWILYFFGFPSKSIKLIAKSCESFTFFFLSFHFILWFNESKRFTIKKLFQTSHFRNFSFYFISFWLFLCFLLVSCCNIFSYSWLKFKRFCLQIRNFYRISITEISSSKTKYPSQKEEFYFVRFEVWGCFSLSMELEWDTWTLTSSAHFLQMKSM